MKRAINVIGTIIITAFAFLIILKPQEGIHSALDGLFICGNVIIPSIYPFTFCVLFINKSGVLSHLKPINKISTKLFGLNYYEFSVFLLSLIGGYPIGAKILNDNNVSKANLMINYCVNAGPAFIILAVGKGIFKSSEIGWILFISHILSSIIIMALFTKKVKKVKVENKTILAVNAVENFVTSATDAAQTVIKICGFIILFSVIKSYFTLFSSKIKAFYYLSLLLEVTNSIYNCNNIFAVAFLLGFAGISIWAQVFSLSKNLKINYLKFIAIRILHGSLSALIVFILLKFFKISVQTLSNGQFFSFKPFINGPTVAFSLIITGIVLIISLYNKKYAGNLMEDIV